MYLYLRYLRSQWSQDQDEIARVVPCVDDCVC